MLSAAGCTAAVNTVLEKFGGVDIIVNVLGGSSAPSGGFAVLDEQEWENTLNQNLMSAVRIDRGLLPAMLVKKPGVIVHVTSIQTNYYYQSPSQLMPRRKRRTVKAYRKRWHQKAFALCVYHPVG